MINLDEYTFALVCPEELTIGDIIDGDKHKYLVLGSSKTAVHRNHSLYIMREDDPQEHAFWMHYYVNNRIYAYLRKRS